MSPHTATPSFDFATASYSCQTILRPDASQIFANRAQRFRHLAEHHALADWLHYLGHLTQRQHEMMATLSNLPLPDTTVLEPACRHGMPPLNAASLLRPDAWRTTLQYLIDGLIADSPALAQERLCALREAPQQRLESLAAALLKGHPAPSDLPDLPLIAAALQAVWTAWAARIDPTSLTLLDTPEVCPCCGSLPVTSIVRTATDTTQINNLRYLHCGLCNTEWNVPRAVCTVCANDKRISYQQIDGSNGCVRAECCDACHSYLKLLMQEQDAGVDPVADDLATLALDLLVDEAGYSRSGPNLLLLGGAG